MRYKEVLPHTSLSRHIACYFFIEVGVEEEKEELIIPDGTHGLMFVQHSKFTRLSNNGENKVGKSYVFGQKSKGVRYCFDTPGLFCFGVKFQPHGLKPFTGIQVNELKDKMIEASEVLGKGFDELEDKTLSSPTIQEKKLSLDSFFLQKLETDKNVENMLVDGILTEIHKQQGKVEIATLLTAFNIGYKRLERLFKKHIGLSPKTYCRIVRFNNTLFHQSQFPAENLTQLAYSAGYFDQMHFIKEVKHFTELTPKALFENGLGHLANHQRQLVAQRLT